MKTRLSWALVALTGTLAPRSALADATIHAGHETLFPHRVAIATQVTAQVEVTQVTLTFAGLTAAGDYVLTVPSPEGASSIGVELDRGQGFEPLPISRKAPPTGVSGGPNGDAAVQAWEGDTPLLATLSGLTPGPLKVRARFMRLLRRYGGEVKLAVGAAPCPLRASASAAPPELEISIAVRTFRGLETIVADGLPGSWARPASNEARLSYGPAPLHAATRATVRYREQGSGIHAQFISHRTPDADPLGGKAGYFLLVIDADRAGADAGPPRTLDLVIDRSGSMSGQKIDQARTAAMAMLEHLRPTDRFNIHAFNDQLSSWRGAPAQATSDQITAARDFVRALSAYGSTDLDAGITAGLGCAGDGELDQRFDALVLLSDGQPTAGITDPAQIHQRSVAHNCRESRIFTFSVGYDADRALLEAIARSSRGKNFVLNDAQANSQLGAAVRELFEDIHAVRLSGIDLTLAGNGAHDVLPEKPLDLFDGGQVLVVGRYETPGAGTARITARAAGSPFARDLALQLPADEDDNAFIKHVWATEKVGALLARLASGGDREALEREITDLGLAYSIQTPYTSFASPPGYATGGGAPTASAGGSGSSSGSSSGGGVSGGSGFGGGDYGGGALDPLALLLAIGLLPLALRRRRAR